MLLQPIANCTSSRPKGPGAAAALQHGPDELLAQLVAQWQMACVSSKINTGLIHSSCPHTYRCGRQHTALWSWTVSPHQSGLPISREFVNLLPMPSIRSMKSYDDHSPLARRAAHSPVAETGENAGTDVSQALKMNPRSAEAHTSLGLLLIRESISTKKDYSISSRRWNADPNSATAHNNLGFDLAERGQVDEASPISRRPSR